MHTGSVHSRSKGEISTCLELARITHTAGDASVRLRHVKRKPEHHLVLKTSRLETKTVFCVKLQARGVWDSFHSPLQLVSLRPQYTLDTPGYELQ